uniref:Hypothetical capsid protein n=1 Tax=uncultured virus TaxID=340016 RepID=A0A1D8MK62_9VIRU|nr:hypothetical capsid protein [uncultured virus]
MAKSLSKRQRTQVRQIIHQEIRPEWKCIQGAIGPTPHDISSNGIGYSLFQGIAQSVDADGRVGNEIRVHRVDVWYFWVAPVTPENPEWTACGNRFLRVKDSNGVKPTNSSSPYDLSIYTQYMNGPAPELQERKFDENVKFHKPKKHRLAGLPVVSGTVWAQQAQNDVDDILAVPQVITTGTGSQTIPAHNILKFQPLVTPKYPAQIYRKQSIVYRKNGGLKVTYTDANVTGASDKNHVYWQCWAQLGAGFAGSSGAKCPTVTAGYRVWFSDV